MGVVCRKKNEKFKSSNCCHYMSSDQIYRAHFNGGSFPFSLVCCVVFLAPLSEQILTRPTKSSQQDLSGQSNEPICPSLASRPKHIMNWNFFFFVLLWYEEEKCLLHCKANLLLTGALVSGQWNLSCAEIIFMILFYFEQRLHFLYVGQPALHHSFNQKTHLHATYILHVYWQPQWEVGVRKDNDWCRLNSSSVFACGKKLPEWGW